MNDLVRSAAAAVLCSLALLCASPAAGAVTFIEGRSPTAEAEKTAQKAFKMDKTIYGSYDDMKLGNGFAPYVLDSDNKLRPMEGVYLYPVLNGEKIIGGVSVTETDGAGMTFSAGKNPLLIKLNDTETSVNSPARIIVHEGHFIMVGDELADTFREYPFDEDEYERALSALTGGSIEFSVREYNIAVEGAGSLESLVSDAEDDFYSLNGDIYCIKDGKFQTGWQKHGKYTYYMDSSGKAVTGKKLISGTMYSFSDRGVCKGKFTGKYTDKKGVRYFRNGRVMTGSLKINGSSYITDSKGYILK